MLHIRFFGTPGVSLDDQPLHQLTRSPILTSLFAYLVSRRDQPCYRCILAAFFWPDLPEAQARHNLSAHLWRLRQSLAPSSGPVPFLVDQQTIQFNPTACFWLDVAEFEAATAVLRQTPHANISDLTEEAIRRLEYAVSLYGGEFLEGVYAEWCLGQREQLREQYRLALETLARAHQAHGHYEAALYAARQLAQADPYCEAAHFQLIQLYVRLGKPNEAHAHCQHYEAIWRDELKLEPSACMLALADPQGT